MKKIILFAAAAALFAACSSDNDLVQQEQPLAQNETDANLISFDAYTMRSTTTRAGWAGQVSTTALQETTGSPAPLGASGFGVFAYYTDNFDYTPLYVPNFMYNEQVTWNSGSNEFKYDLPKYWPNEHGSAAQSADQDRVSFFAYTPYVNVDPSTGMLAEGGTPLDASDEKLQWGITGTKRNTLQGDPIIQYITSFDQSKSVDLCWATTGSTDITWSTNNSTQKIVAGYPWLNVRKPDGVVGDGAKVKFNFQHATAKLIVKVSTDFTGGWKTTEPEKTKVWVRSIRFTGIAQKAALNLNNPKTANPNKARWMDYYGTNELELGESVTVYDGRKDGSEGVLDALAPNETVQGLNPKVVQVENQIVNNQWLTSGSGVMPGVTSSPVNLFCEADEGAIYVIPTGEKVNVEIVYDIETIDTKLPTVLSDGETPGSTVENRISKAITFGTATSKLENGKKYTINLKLGLKDVKFDATVNETWEDAGSADAYLPNNMPSFAAYTGDSHLTLGISGDKTEYTFAVTGLKAGETVSATSIAAPVKNSGGDAPTIGSTVNGTDGVADANGIAFVKIKLDAYGGVTNSSTTNNITVTGATSNKKVVLDITQFAVKLGLTAPATKTAVNAGEFYVYTKTGSAWYAEPTDGSTKYIKLWVNGIEKTGDNFVIQTADTPSPGADKFAFNTTDGHLICGSATSQGDIIRLTIKTGDVAPETVTFTVE